MNQALKVLHIFTKMQEQSSLFQHKQESLFDKMSLGEVHCIDCIGMMDHPNVTKISEKMGLSRATISKISKKLLGKGLIESYQDSDNKKEIYFRLTEDGQYIYGEHKRIHSEVRQEWLSLLNATVTTSKLQYYDFSLILTIFFTVNQLIRLKKNNYI